MKKVILIAAAANLALYAGLAALAETPENARGRILLQTEARGEAWYVSPEDSTRTYLPDGGAAFAAMRTFGLGITNRDLALIPVGLDSRIGGIDTDGDGLPDRLEEGLETKPDVADSDDDGYSDGDEVRNGFNPLGSGKMTTDTKLVQSVLGHILLQVEAQGQAWYVSPTDGKRYYMKDGASAYEIMRWLGLGATNATLAMIPLNSKQLDCGYDLQCFARATENRQPAKVIRLIKTETDGVIRSEETLLMTELVNETLSYSEDLLTVFFDYSAAKSAELLSQGKTDAELQTQLNALNVGDTTTKTREGLNCTISDAAKLALQVTSATTSGSSKNDLAGFAVCDATPTTTEPESEVSVDDTVATDEPTTGDNTPTDEAEVPTEEVVPTQPEDSDLPQMTVEEWAAATTQEQIAADAAIGIVVVSQPTTQTLTLMTANGLVMPKVTAWASDVKLFFAGLIPDEAMKDDAFRDGALDSDSDAMIELVYAAASKPEKCWRTIVSYSGGRLTIQEPPASGTGELYPCDRASGLVATDNWLIDSDKIMADAWTRQAVDERFGYVSLSAAELYQGIYASCPLIDALSRQQAIYVVHANKPYEFSDLQFKYAPPGNSRTANSARDLIYSGATGALLGTVLYDLMESDLYWPGTCIGG